MKIKEVRHLVTGYYTSSAGQNQGAKSINDVNELVTKLAQEYDEVQTHLVKAGLDERGDPAFIMNEYIFIKYEDTPAKAKKE